MRIAKVQFLKRPKGLQFGSPPFRAWFYSWLTDTDTGCQEWRGCRKTDGYSQFEVGGMDMYSHRVAWMLEHGDIPAGRIVRHLCHNRVCCNVNHLELGSHKENAKDKIDAGRNRDAPDMSQTESIKVNEYRKLGMVFGSPDFIDYFWNNAKRVGACLEWQGTNSNGYGQLYIDGKMELVHRLAWRLWYGDIPDGMVIRHKVCDNTICVDVHHLAIGTQFDNVHDMIAKGRHVTALGESNGNAKLTDDDVRSILAEYATGNYTQKEIAKAYCVGHPAIHSIVNRKTWKHVD